MCLPWVESSSRNFVARHQEREERRRGRGARPAGGHARAAGAAVRQRCPTRSRSSCTPAASSSTSRSRSCRSMRRLTTPVARRYIAGWAGRGVLHVLDAAAARRAGGEHRRLARDAAADPGRAVRAARRGGVQPGAAAALVAARDATGDALRVAHRRRGAVVLRPDRARAPGDRAAPARGRAARVPAIAARRRAARRQRSSTSSRPSTASRPL